MAVVTQEFIDGLQNDYLAEVAARYPDRFLVCGMCDWRKPGFLPEALRLMDDRGFRALAIPAHRLAGGADGRVSLLGDEMMQLFKAMEQRGVILSLCLADDEAQIAEADELMQECPRLKIAIGHFGMVTDSDTVMVIGCGMIGIGAIVRASLRGATVIAVDLDDEKLELARRIGARYSINSQTENLHERLMQLTDGLGPTVVIEAVGSPATYVTAVQEVAFTGRVVCIGYAKSDTSFQTKQFVQKEMDIRGSRNALPADFRAVIRYMVQGTCPVDKLITRTVTPDEAADTMQQWSEQPGKVFRILVSFDN